VQASPISLLAFQERLYLSSTWITSEQQNFKSRQTRIPMKEVTAGKHLSPDQSVNKTQTTTQLPKGSAFHEACFCRDREGISC
jgi:hypothetical protein